MNFARAILSGAITWVFIFCSFAIMSFIPVIKDSDLLQQIVICLLLIPFVIIGAKYYYKKGDKIHGLKIGSLMVATGLLLDALFTVPLVIIPQDGTYADFYSRPFIWIIVVEFVTIVYLYWKNQVK